MDDYIGVGPSAHGKIGMLRYYVPSNIKRYIERADKGVFVRENEEILTPESAFDEYVMTGLRLDEGVDIAEGERRFDRVSKTATAKTCGSALVTSVPKTVSCG